MTEHQLIPRRTIGALVLYERKPKPKGIPKYAVGPAGCTDNDTLRQFGRYSAAIRFMKAALPRETPHVVVIMDGIDIEAVISTHPCNYTVLDVSADQDPTEYTPVIGLNGVAGNKAGGTACHVSPGEATVNPVRVKEIIHTLELHEQQTA